MRKLLSLYFLLLIGLTSCAQDNSIAQNQSRAFFDSIHLIIDANVPLQQSLIDNLGKTLLILQNGDFEEIDTSELKLLYDSAIKVHSHVIEEVSRIKEIDTLVNYKAQVLTYNNIWYSFLQNEFLKYISLLTKQSKPELLQVRDLLMPKMIIIKQKELELKESQRVFRIKYRINGK